LDCAVDVCSFRGPRGLTRLELYLELAAERLVVSDSLDAALFRVEVSATPIDASGHDEPHPYENVWRRGVAAGAGGLRGRVVGDVFQFDLVPGEYAMQARVADEVGRGSWERQWRLDVPDYDSEDLRTSGLQIALSASRTGDDVTNPFAKNAIVVIPNPRRRLAYDAGRLVFYFEAYGFTPAGVGLFSYILEDSDGIRVVEESRRVQTGLEGVARADSLDLSSIALHEGHFILTVVAVDASTGAVGSSSREVAVFDEPAPGLTDPASIDQYLAEMVVVAEPGELDVFNRLNTQGKLGFVDDFWERRDPTPLTSKNEFAERKRSRLTEISRDGSGVRGPDMEQVYLSLGPPDRVDDADASWFYDTVGPYPFRFGPIRPDAGRELVESALPFFVDATVEAGLDFRHVNGASGRFYYPEINTGGICVFDADGDGWMDIYMVNGASLPGHPSYGKATDRRSPTNALYRNLGNGRFADVTESSGTGDGSYGMGCAAADVDNDGDVDLYVTNFGPNVLFRNEGEGRFSDITRAAGVGDDGWGSGCAFADVDGDGFLDLYVANYLNYQLGDEVGARTRFVAKDMPAGVEEARTYADPHAFPPAANRFYLNRGDGTFAEMAGTLGIASDDGRDLGVVFSDVDDDGDPDLFVATDDGPNRMFRNDRVAGSLAFEETGLVSGVAYDAAGEVQATMGAAFYDSDNDGLLDLTTTSYQGEPFAFYQNLGESFFTEASAMVGLAGSTRPMLGWGVVPLDFDNDGWLDLFVANGHVHDHIATFDPRTSAAQRNQLFRNDRSGRYLDLSRLAGPGLALQGQSRAAARIDYDNDGDPDLLVLDKASQDPNARPPGVVLLRNEGGYVDGRANHWLTVQLRGRPGRSNRDGVGAKVTIWTRDGLQVREAAAGSSFQSQDDPRLHFGLGQAGVVDSLHVRWPSGKRQTHRDIRANRILTLEESN